MNDNDIIKALEFCESPTCECTGECPMFHNGINSISDCRGELHKNALDLINRLKAENEKLSKENLTLKDGYFQKRYEEDEHTELLAVREAWRKAGMDYIDLNAEWEGKYKTAKAEAIKEFAERLKKCLKKRTEYDEGGWDVDLFTVTEEDIDSLVKEMTEAINNAENDTD